MKKTYIDDKKLCDALEHGLQSANINFLLGAGFSCPVLGSLGNIEQKLTKNEENIEAYVEFFNKVMFPLLDEKNIDVEYQERCEIFKSINEILKMRDSSVLHKICNVFTTNYDPLVELAFENAGIDYNDGFNGKIWPVFSTNNYGRIILRQAGITGRTEECPSFNLYKLHGSLSWTVKNDRIEYISYLEQISALKSFLDNDAHSFIDEYHNRLAIINPTKDKLNITVLNSNYYDQLRMLSNQLEHETTVLFVVGFSFRDEHIRTLIERALNNTTLKMYVFSYDKQDSDYYESIFSAYNNVTIIENIIKTTNEDGTMSKAQCLMSKEAIKSLFVEVENGIKWYS